MAIPRLLRPEFNPRRTLLEVIGAPVLFREADVVEELLLLGGGVG